MQLPLPPGCTPTLWGDDERWVEAYLGAIPGYYLTADAGYIDDDGYVFVMSRTDDVINIAGHRLSTGAMEEVLASHPDVAECAVVGVADELKGQVPIGFAVLKAGVERDRRRGRAAELVALVRDADRAGGVASRTVRIVDARSRRRARASPARHDAQHGRRRGRGACPPTIEDPAVLDDLRDVLLGMGRRPAAATDA